MIKTHDDLSNSDSDKILFELTIVYPAGANAKNSCLIFDQLIEEREEIPLSDVRTMDTEDSV